MNRDSCEQILITNKEFERQWPADSIFDRVKQLEGNVVRKQAGRITQRFELNGQGYYSKWHSGVGWLEIIKNVSQCKWPVLGAQNEWDALNKLRELHIPSMTPIAFGRRGLNPATQESFIITQELSDIIQLDDFFRRYEEDNKKLQLLSVIKWKIITRVATIARQLHQAGINHRDFYLCHFMLRESSLSTGTNTEILPDIYLMDLHRARMRSRVPQRWLIKDLGGLLFSAFDLGFTQRDFWRFARVYFSMDARQIILNHQNLLKKIKIKAEKIYRKDIEKRDAQKK
jgi:UDP-glucose:(heptosyl)LPS alpha-1,3-glucosyltransferase